MQRGTSRDRLRKYNRFQLAATRWEEFRTTQRCRGVCQPRRDRLDSFASSGPASVWKANCRSFFRRTQFGWWTSFPVSDDGDRSGTRLRFSLGPGIRSEPFRNASTVAHYPLGTECYRAPEMRQWQLTFVHRTTGKRIFAMTSKKKPIGTNPAGNKAKLLPHVEISWTSRQLESLVSLVSEKAAPPTDMLVRAMRD